MREECSLIQAREARTTDLKNQGGSTIREGLMFNYLNLMFW